MKRNRTPTVVIANVLIGRCRYCPDATHAALRARGVDADAEVSRMGDPVPPMFWFRDPSGHTLLVVQQS